MNIVQDIMVQATIEMIEEFLAIGGSPLEIPAALTDMLLEEGISVEALLYQLYEE